MVNPLSSAIRCVDAVTTVSLSYLKELMDSANGLETLFRSFHYKCFGLLNGIDNEVWDPSTDPYISYHYNSKNVDEMKLKNKVEICELFALDASKPLIVFIGRAVSEKGADMLPAAISKALRDMQGACNFLVLGSGDKGVERSLDGLKAYFPGHYNCYIGYNEQLSHKMYAAADFILMPSRVEPCGLNQMYALRYATIPMVRSVGGLKDTVVDFGSEGGFGIRFNQASVQDIVSASYRAVELFYDYQDSFLLIRRRMMAIDHSWEKSTEQYLKLYQSL
jgi:starch synthase